MKCDIKAVVLCTFGVRELAKQRPGESLQAKGLASIKAWNMGGCGTFAREWEDKDRKEHSQRDPICCGFNLHQILRMLTAEIKL